MRERMISRGDHYWRRLFGTGLSFTLFGIGGLVLRLAIFPLLQLIPGSPRQRAARARLTLHYVLRIFVGIMRGLGLISYEIHGVERLNKPGQLIVANHPSLIDVVFLISLVRDANCIVKSSLFNNPCMRGPLRHAGYISNSASDSMLADCVAALHRGDSLIIFPEGTRSVPGKPLQFHRGAAYVALAAGLPMTPVTIQCEPSMLTKQEKWYQIPPRRGHFVLSVGENIHNTDIASENLLPSQAARKVTSRWLRHFNGQIAQPGAVHHLDFAGETMV
jgi:1-acyl-sn-glycerol-3-phosphate acyltransferase